MRNHKKALLSTAILAAITAGSVQAGTEACFEVYKGADGLGVTAFGTVYGGAACVAEASRVGAGAADLEPTDEAAIAYELTGALNVDFDAVDTVNTDQQIIYIPTTDIPGGTLITMQLSGAVFNGNANQIHLVKEAATADGAGGATDFEAVASSDGALDGTNTVTFLTKAGVTIGAGTRLALSRVSTGLDDTEFDPIGIRIENTTCTSPSSSQQVTISSTSAITDGGTGFSIAGGVSAAQPIVDISAQFHPFNGGTTAEVEVNAESSDSVGTAIVARTEFVYEAGDVTDQLVARRYEAVYKTGFYNRGVAAVLDQFITLDADDHVETQFVATADPGADVDMLLWNTRDASDGTVAFADAVDVETGTTPGAFGLTKAAAPLYNTEAVDLFTPSASIDAEPNTATGSIAAPALYNAMYYVVTNTNPATIMNFNYDVNADYTLDFGTAGELDHCNANIQTHDIGVNGAVLKVPYAVDGTGNFVRVTNEHTEAAEVTVDVFGESQDGTAANRKATAVTLGTVPAQSSIVYFVPDVIDAAETQQGYLGADGGYATGAFGSNTQSSPVRHSLTFTVTAPRDSVHGVTVQKIVGGVDRVMTVLDENVWTQ